MGGRSYARYEAQSKIPANLTSTIAGGADATLQNRCGPPSSAPTRQVHHNAADFFEFWSTALDAERALSLYLKRNKKINANMTESRKRHVLGAHKYTLRAPVVL